jgi:hypothetical protein
MQHHQQLLVLAGVVMVVVGKGLEGLLEQQQGQEQRVEGPG